MRTKGRDECVEGKHGTTSLVLGNWNSNVQYNVQCSTFNVQLSQAIGFAASVKRKRSTTDASTASGVSPIKKMRFHAVAPVVFALLKATMKCWQG
jgi:hypothetical protein